MIRGFIVCAGKQSRFKSKVPKALVNIRGKSLLLRNIEAISVCDEIYVICSTENESAFVPEELGAAKKIVITSGFGSGDAVWQVLRGIDVQKGDIGFILWGDSLQREEIINYLLDCYDGVSLIPCVVENNPYVCVSDNKKGGVNVYFSKFGETVSRGYHDLSLFCCDILALKIYLCEFHDAIYAPNGRYYHKHGNEMEFLDVINETNIKAKIIVFTDYREFAFNTVEQLNVLLEQSDN